MSFEILLNNRHNRKCSVDGELNEVMKTIQVTKEQADEQRDRENRRNHIILYNVPESELPWVEDRSKADMDFCLLLFNRCLNAGVSDEDTVKVFRLGEKKWKGKTIIDPAGRLSSKKLNYGITL